MAIWLNEADVRAVLPMADVIGAMERTLADFSAGKARQPVRTVIAAGKADSFFASMPAYLEAGSAMGAKLVTVFPQNAAIHLSTHQAVIVLMDGQTGRLLAVMDGRYITEARTAAGSAVAVRFLARQGARKLAILGSGVQAGSHLEAFEHVRRFEEIRCWSPTAAHLRQFAARHAGVTAARNAEEAVREADVVLTVTASTKPVVSNEWVADGACVISIGACVPGQRELDPRLVARGRVFADSRAAALKESGDIVIAMAEGHIGPEHVEAELGEVIGGAAAGRKSETEVIIYKPLGIAVEDVAAAHLAYERAMAAGRGVELG